MMLEIIIFILGIAFLCELESLNDNLHETKMLDLKIKAHSIGYKIPAKKSLLSKWFKGAKQ